MNILKNKPVMKLYKYSVIAFNLINKYLYIATLLTFLVSIFSSLNQSKLYKIISTILRIIFILNLILGTGIIIYFTDLIDPINQTYALYYEILKPYIDFLKKLYYDLINIDVEESLISNVKNSNTIKNEIKLGIKEAFDEIISENSTPDNTNLLKPFALACSVLFFSYFFFILPGSSISPEELTSYNLFNQSLIEFKILVKDYFFTQNPGTPGSPIIPSTPSTPSSPSVSINTYLPESVVNNPSPILSEGLSTVTPNTPVASSSSLSPFLKLDKSVGVQTVLDGITVSKSISTVDILADVLDEDNATLIKSGVNKIIIKLTD